MTKLNWGDLRMSIIQPTTIKKMCIKCESSRKEIENLMRQLKSIQIQFQAIEYATACISLAKERIQANDDSLRIIISNATISAIMYYGSCFNVVIL